LTTYVVNMNVKDGKVISLEYYCLYTTAVTNSKTSPTYETTTVCLVCKVGKEVIIRPN